MRTHFLWGLAAIIFALSYGSVGAYKLLDSLEDAEKSCPARNLNGPRRTFDKPNAGEPTCGISERREIPKQLQLSFINIRGPATMIIPRSKVEPRPGLNEPKRPRRRLFLILNERPKNSEPVRICSM